jgi:site-specific DNA-adenine methylase
MISAGISQIGGKFRLRKRLLKLVPKHDYFLSPFCGACWFELNKLRSKYECFNDRNSDIINYLYIIQERTEEFEAMKTGIFGLNSQYLFKKIVSGEIIPRNDVERAYFFYYTNKLGFAGACSASANGFSYQKAVRHRGITVPTVFKKSNIKTQHKGMQVKTTRPYSNNDNGLMTRVDPRTIDRLRFVALTDYDFKKAYKLFYRATFQKKGLSKECFVYFDPPYPGTEKYYGNRFRSEDHFDLLEIALGSPFNVMLSIGGECELYLDMLKEAKWFVHKLITSYSTSANNQNERIEYACLNYDPKEVPKMVNINQSTLAKFIEVVQ